MTKCWVDNTLKISEYGYARPRIKGKSILAHRLSFEVFYGFLPEIVHHKCNNKLCYNPNHLEAQTRSSHCLLHLKEDGHPNSLKITCPLGHTYSHYDILGRRVCRICKNAASARYKLRKRGM